MNGVLDAVGSTSRAGQKPADWTSTVINDKSGAAECGAEVLTVLIVHEVYHQFLLGSNVQGALMKTTAQGLPLRNEGNECV
jgi:hypothetical protein